MATPELTKLANRAQVAVNIQGLIGQLDSAKTNINSIKNNLITMKTVMEGDTSYFSQAAIDEVDVKLTKINDVIATWVA